MFGLFKPRRKTLPRAKGPPISSAHIRVLKSHASMGDAKAQVELALRYMHGQGVAKNNQEADYWLQKAARNGHPKGLLYLAYMYQNAGEHEEAEKFFIRAVEAGDTEAAEKLGQLYMDGGFFIRDQGKAVYYYKLAADAGRPAAQRLYAECVLLGKGMEQDIEAGTLEMQVAADMGDRTAREILAMGIDAFVKNRGHSFVMIGEPEAEDAAPGAEAAEDLSDFGRADPRESPPVRLRPAPENRNKSENLNKSAAEPLEMPPAMAARPRLIPEDNKMSLQEAMSQLDRLIGLDEAKSAIHGLTNRMRLHKLREEHKLPVAPVSTHMVFSGNPGTGKTTVARLLGNIFREIGLLKKGHVIETSRADLVAEYVGQTAPLVQQKVSEALDGILFIDEAYSLLDRDAGQGGFGGEAVAMLLKLMEDNRHRLVVVIAGYEDKMNELLSSNPGLSSRFSRTINFEDFNGYELFQIFESFADDFGYVIDMESAEALSTVIQMEIQEKDIHFGNARFMRQLFDEALNCLANRVAQIRNPRREDLVHIRPEDVHEAYRNINA